MMRHNLQEDAQNYSDSPLYTYQKHTYDCSTERADPGRLVHVLLAGDAEYTPFILEGRNKSLLEFPGGILLDYILHAFSESRTLSTLVVVGPDCLRHRIPGNLDQRPVHFLPQGANFMQNIRNSLEMLAERWPGSRAVFVTNDAPLLSGREIDNFYSIASTSDADIVVGLAQVSDAELATPLGRQYRRSAVPLSDGLYLLANQVSCNYRVARVLPAIKSFFALRKQSAPGTLLKTVSYAMRDTQRVRLLFSWVSTVMAKAVWRITGRNCSNLALVDLERNLESIVQRTPLAIQLRIIPYAQGCWDVDTEKQLGELRSLTRLCSRVGSLTRWNL